MKHFQLMLRYSRQFPKIIKDLEQLPHTDSCRKVIPALKKCLTDSYEHINQVREDKSDDEDENSSSGRSGKGDHHDEIINF